MARAISGKKFSGTTFVTQGGGGGSSFNLTVEEQDGNPTVSNVNTIRVSNGTLTDEGGGVVSIVTGGGSVTPQTFGEIIDAGGTTQALTATYSGFNTGGVGQITNMTFASGAGSDPDTLSPDTDGTYQAVATFSVSSQSANRVVTAALSKNGVIDTDTEVSRDFSSTGSSGAFAITKLLNLSAGDEIGVELKSDSNTTIDIDNISFNLTSIGTGGSGGTGTPAAPVNSVQFNNAGVFGGSSQFIYDSATQRVGIGNSTPARKLDVRETTTQLRLEYDATEHTDIYTDAAGELQIVPSGGVVIQPTALNSNIRHGSYVLDAATTDASPTVMTIKPGSGAMTLVDNSTWFFDAMVVGKQDASANSITVKLEGAVNRNGAGATILGGVLNLIVFDSSVGAWNVSATVAGNNLQVTVTGAAATTVDWSAHVRTTEVQD